MAKEKHLKAKKELEKVQVEYGKYREETEIRLENMRNENSLLNNQINKLMADSAEMNERNS